MRTCLEQAIEKAVALLANMVSFLSRLRPVDVHAMWAGMFGFWCGGGAHSGTRPSNVTRVFPGYFNRCGYLPFQSLMGTIENQQQV